MTLEMEESLKRELDGAMSWPDADTRTERILRAHSNILLANMSCQRKTGERVKKLQWKFTLAIFSLGAGGGTALSNWDLISRILFGN